MVKPSPKPSSLTIQLCFFVEACLRNGLCRFHVPLLHHSSNHTFFCQCYRDTGVLFPEFLAKLNCLFMLKKCSGQIEESRGNSCFSTNTESCNTFLEEVIVFTPTLDLVIPFLIACHHQEPLQQTSLCSQDLKVHQKKCMCLF